MEVGMVEVGLRVGVCEGQNGERGELIFGNLEESGDDVAVIMTRIGLIPRSDPTL